MRYGLVLLAFGFVGCGQAGTPAAPSPAVAPSLQVVTAPPLVTMHPDLTVSPDVVTVAVGGKVRIQNATARPTQIQSSNCWEFNLMALPAGYTKNTQAFLSAKTCDYWALNNRQKIFVGRVVVQ